MMIVSAMRQAHEDDEARFQDAPRLRRRARWRTLNGSVLSAFQRSSQGLGGVVRMKSPGWTSFAVHSPPSSAPAPRPARLPRDDPDELGVRYGRDDEALLHRPTQDTCAGTSRHGRPLLDAINSPGTPSSSASAVLSGLSMAGDSGEEGRAPGNLAHAFGRLCKTLAGSGTHTGMPISTISPCSTGVQKHAIAGDST